jgi:hypothetical protein
MIQYISVYLSSHRYDYSSSLQILKYKDVVPLTEEIAALQIGIDELIALQAGINQAVKLYNLPPLTATYGLLKGKGWGLDYNDSTILHWNCIRIRFNCDWECSSNIPSYNQCSGSILPV